MLAVNGSRSIPYRCESPQYAQRTYYKLHMESYKLHMERVLRDAAAAGDLAGVKELIESHCVDVSAADEGGKTPLILTAENGHLDVILYLIKIENGQAFKNSLSPMVLNLKGLIWSAVSRKHFAIESCLTNFKTDMEIKLRAAAAAGNLEDVEALIESRCVDVNAAEEDESSLTALDSLGKNILQIAVSRGYLDVVKYLVETVGMNINAQDLEQGDVPITHAIASGHREVIRYLVADPDIDLDCEPCDYSALGFAARECSLGIVKFLIKEIGLNPFEEGEKNSAVFEAILKGRLEIVQWLVERYPEDMLHYKDGEDRSCLSLAKACKHENLIKFFEDKGADA